jgi:hypothetical protein
MKKISFAIAVTLVVLSSFAVRAAAEDRVLARTNIPFAFSAQGQQLSAGNYELLQITDNTLVLHNRDTRKGVMLLCQQGNIVPSDKVKLVFRVHDTDHFLASVVTPSYEITLPKSKSERQIEDSATTTDTVAVQAKH